MSNSPSSPPQRTPQRTVEHERVTELMREIKSKDGYEPIPWSQVRYFGGITESLKERLFCWLFSKTLRKGHWCAYAVETGQSGEKVELHLSHAAKALNEDPANVRRAWRQGVAEGRWRNGTPQEGRARLYIRGDVPAPDAPAQRGEENSKEVTTDPFPWAISRQIKDWPEEKVAIFRVWYGRRGLLRDGVIADMVAITRDALDEDDDNALRAEWGIEPNRNEEHHYKNPGREADRLREMAARQARVQPLLPAVQELVQTYWKSVQNSQNGAYKAPQNANGAPVSLSPERTPREPLERVSGISTPAAASPPTPPSYGEKPVNEQYAPAPLDEPAQNAVGILFGRLKKMQAAHPKARLAEADIDPENAGNQAWARKILTHVQAGEMEEFCGVIESHISRHALGKKAELGLVLRWAEDFGRGRAERARRREAARLAAEKAAAADADLRTKREAQRARDQRLTDAMDAMPMDEWDRRMKVAAQELKADPEKLRMMRNMTRDQRDELARVRARLKLATEIAARADLGVAGKWEDCPVCGNRSARHIELGVCLGDCAAQKGAAHG